jgi:hypothetical protein
MKSAVFAIVCLSMLYAAAAWPCLSCASYTCTDGWWRKTNVPAANIGCLNGACTNRVCCNPPNCASFSSPGCSLKANAAAIQCPGETLSGCSAQLCCSTIEIIR